MKEEIAKLLAKELGMDKEEIEGMIEIPPSMELGDFAFPCFKLASVFKKSPMQIAVDLAAKLETQRGKNLEKIEAKGPYVNFFLNKSLFVYAVIEEILKKKEDYGKGKENEEICIEHTSLNPNSSPHVGRARNSIIGDSLKRILEFSGNDVEAYYYVNDVSKQIAILALDFKARNFDDLLKLYVKNNKRLEKNKKMEKKVFEMLEMLERGDKKTKAMFRKIVDIAVKGQRRILQEFGIKFDRFDYESAYIEEEKKLLDEFAKTGKLFKDDEGRLVLDQRGFGLEDKMKNTVLVLARSNGTGLYVLRDLAYTIDKIKRCKKSYIVLGEDQKLYFEQLKAALSMLGKKAPEVIHYSFVLLGDEKGARKMATRKGDVVLLEDFMEEARKKAEKEIKKRQGKGLANPISAKKIGYGAVKYAFLKNDSNKNIIFNWKQALSFEGNTGPYLQYSYARASSIIKKVKKKDKANTKIELNRQEERLVKKLGEFPDAVAKARENLNPSIIANYSYELCQKFNEFYHSSPVLGSKEQEQRLKIVEAFRIVLKSALGLLGIEVIEKM